MNIYIQFINSIRKVMPVNLHDFKSLFSHIKTISVVRQYITVDSFPNSLFSFSLINRV